MERLQTLIEVARRGSITEAARALGLTQPAVSRRIQQLESEFSAPLLHRSRRGVALTEVGRLVLEEATTLADRYGRLKETVGAHVRLEQGAVRVGGGATAVSFLLPPLIATFRRRHGGVVFHLVEAGSRDVEAAVLAESIELGIVTLPARSDELVAVPLRRDPIVLVAARGHALAGAGRIQAAALRGMPLIGFEEGSAIRRIIDRALDERGIEVELVMQLRSIQSILRMVALDLGLAFVSRMGVAHAGESVAVIDVRGLRIARSLAVIRKRGRPLSAAARAFLEHLRSARRNEHR
jgi:molybdate transport repressor ModE-like protein